MCPLLQSFKVLYWTTSCDACKQNKMTVNEETWRKRCCFRVKHRHDNSVANPKCAHVNRSIVYNMMRKEKAPIHKLSRSKAPLTQQICHKRQARKTSWPFLLYNTGVDFSFRNNFANVGSFAKVSVPAESIIPLFSKVYIHTYSVYAACCRLGRYDLWLALF